MFIYIGAQRGENGEVLRHYHAVSYKPEQTGEWPWGDGQFDCVIAVCTPVLDRKLANGLAEDVVRWNVDYVQTTGADAELLHDLIDETEVMAQLENLVGERTLMTTWHDDARAIPQMAEVAYHCFGGADNVLLLVVGSSADLDEVTKQVRRLL